MKEELEKKKKINKLKEVAKAASQSVGSMVKSALKKEKEKDIQSIKTKIENAKKYRALSDQDKIKVIKEEVKKNTAPGGKDFNEANFENQTAKRYEKVGVSPIYAKGKFDRSDKELDEKYGNRLTEDDEVTSKSKKRNKLQY